MIGVCAGVTTLVIALSMNTGFRQAIRDRLLTVTAHVNLKPTDPEGIHDYRAVISRLESTPGVKSIEPALYDTVLLSTGDHARGIVMKGVDPELERKASAALNHIVAGSGDLSSSTDDIPVLIVGRLLATDFDIQAGDYVTLTSPQGNLTPFGVVPRTRRFRVGGVFDSGFYDYDANWGFVTLPAAQAMAGVGDVAEFCWKFASKIWTRRTRCWKRICYAGQARDSPRPRVDGRESSALSSAKPRKTCNGALHWADHSFVAGLRYSGGADDDGDRCSARDIRGADGHGCAARPDARHFSCSRGSAW